MGYAVDGGVFLVLVGVEPGFHVHAEEFAESLPETGAETSEEGLHDVEGALVGFPVDEFQQDLALILGHVLYHGLILLEDILLEALEMLLARLLVGDCLDIFVGFAKGGESEFGVRESLAHVAHGAPIEFLLLLILELHGRIDKEIVEYGHPDHIAIFVDKPVEASDGFDGDLRILLIFGYVGPASESHES